MRHHLGCLVAFGVLWWHNRNILPERVVLQNGGFATTARGLMVENYLKLVERRDHCFQSPAVPGRLKQVACEQETFRKMALFTPIGLTKIRTAAEQGASKSAFAS